jgi:hypothetical protein
MTVKALRQEEYEIERYAENVIAQRMETASRSSACWGQVNNEGMRLWIDPIKLASYIVPVSKSKRFK